jgi:hypothetical protein
MVFLKQQEHLDSLPGEKLLMARRLSFSAFCQKKLDFNHSRGPPEKLRNPFRTWKLYIGLWDRNVLLSTLRRLPGIGLPTVTRHLRHCGCASNASAVRCGTRKYKSLAYQTKLINENYLSKTGPE